MLGLPTASTSKSGTKKRKVDTSAEESGSKKPRRATHNRGSKGKGKAKESKEPPKWPEYFESLFQIFKALNTVLAFCSSRKHLAITFPVVRKSVEGLLKRPLELDKVAEIKALLPDLIRFAYVPGSELRIHGDTLSQVQAKGRKERAPDYSQYSSQPPSTLPELIKDEDEHVLILDFADPSKGIKSSNAGFLFTNPPTLTPAATKKLIEKRNNGFTQAVNELLTATPEDEDPVSLLQGAARDHIPVNPKSPKPLETPREVPGPQERPSITEVLTEMEEQEWVTDQIVHQKVFEEKPPQNATLETPLSETIEEALRRSRNITSLYTHQVAAIDALSRRHHVVVSTSTASGKSVIYQVPLLRFLERDRHSTAIFIYPTKALAQDQKAALEQLLSSCPGLEHLQVAAYDGDTPQDQRRVIRDTASVIFTNFDMLHASILPHEELWRRFLQNLKLVAVDELHYYNGVFGSHVAQVVRRFRRICAAVGNCKVLFVSCSATIAKPAQFMRNMFGIDDVVEITEDGAPSGQKHFVVWSPPFVDPNEPSLGRKSSLAEATRLMRFLMARGIRVILFCKIRKTCELAMKTLRAELTADGRLDILERVMAYRGGYSPQDRRHIEQEAFSGNLLGIVATNALELGVDIGILDAVIMNGFPMGGIASFRQQAGRAGRRARDALALYVADGSPVDRHYVVDPDSLFDKAMDDLVIDIENNVILEAHLQCASHEVPLTLDDEKYFGPLTKEVCEMKLSKDKDGWYHPHTKYLPYPASHISLRGVEEEKYCVVDVTKLGKAGGQARILEEVEISRAMFEIYEGAVFIHQGLTFLVQEVSHDSRTARLIRADVNWTTDPRDFTNVDAVQTFRIREIKGSPHRAYYGRVEVKTTVFGYFKTRNKKIIDTVDVDTPPWERDTTGMWFDVPKKTLQLLRDIGITPAEAIHAAEHAFLNRFVLAADLGTECKAAEKEYKVTQSERKRPARLIFYEPSGKGGGTSAKAFDHANKIMQDAVDAIERCECEEGCALCILSPLCAENNKVFNKTGALIILKSLLSIPLDADLLTEANASIIEAQDSIVEAETVRAAKGVEIEAGLK